MSFAWSFFGSDKRSVLLGSIFLGFFIVLFLGLPIYLIFKENDYSLSIWYGIIFVLVLFPVSTYIFYKVGCSKLRK